MWLANLQHAPGPYERATARCRPTLHGLRVAIDATQLVGARTGVGVFVSGLLDALARRSDLDLVAYSLTWRHRGRVALHVPDGVRAATRPAPLRPLLAVWRYANWPRIDMWTGPVDVVHGTNFVGPPARVPVVVTVPDVSPLRHPDWLERSALVWARLIRSAVARGAYVHALSQFCADELIEELDIAADHVLVSYPGIPNIAAAAPCHASRFAPGAERYVLAIGTVEPRKDLPTLVAAFDLAAAQHPDVVLVLVGQSAWGTAALDAALAAARHRDRIVQLGFVPDDMKAALLRGATVFAYPSLYEGFGFPPLEAMSVDTPVLATRAGPLAEVLGDSARLVPPGDVAAMAAGLHDLLSDEGQRLELARRGRERVRRYTWDACAEGVVDLYKRAGA